MLILSTITFLTNAQQNCDGTQEQWSNCNTHVSIHLNNSYSWSIARWDVYLNSGWYLWTNEITHPIIISSTDITQYTSSGDILPITWNLINPFITGYQDIVTITLTSNDGPKELFLNFLKDLEPYQSNILKINLDTTAPTRAVPLSLIDWVLHTWEAVQLERTSSSDSWVWLSHYIVAISLDPYFSNPTYIATTWTSITFPENAVVPWTVYRTITSVDFLWNDSTTVRQYFHYLEASKPKAVFWWVFNPPLSNNQPIVNHSIPDIKQENITNNPILILSNNQILILDSTITEIQTQQIFQDLINQFHKSPATNSWTLPGLLPKTWGWSNDIPHTCYYETCLELNMLRQVFYILLLILFLFALRHAMRKN